MSRFIKEVDDVTPNLIPIMNLFTALIPFLLMSAVFFRLSVIQISVPVQSTDTGETDIAKDDDKITLQLQIFADRFDLSASSDSMSVAQLKKLKASVPRPMANDQKATYQQLSQEAYRIKGKYIASDTVIIVPEDNIHYEVVIEAMDAVRKIKLQRDGTASSVRLFPKVVLSSRVK